MKRTGADVAYETTRVPVPRSQQDIREMLLSYGGDGFSLGEGPDFAQIEFAAQGFLVRMRVRKRPNGPELVEAFQQKRKGRRAEAEAQAGEWEAQRVWRVLFWSLKARLIAVEEGLETLTEAFLAHMVDPDSGRTVYEAMTESGALKQLERGGAG